MKIRLTTPSGIEYFRVSNDANGNPRYVVHYLEIPYEDDLSQSFHLNQENHILHAIKVLGGQRYRAKWMGGGIVFSSYDVENLLEEIAGK